MPSRLSPFSEPYIDPRLSGRACYWDSRGTGGLGPRSSCIVRVPGESRVHANLPPGPSGLPGVAPPPLGRGGAGAAAGGSARATGRARGSVAHYGASKGPSCDHDGDAAPSPGPGPRGPWSPKGGRRAGPPPAGGSAPAGRKQNRQDHGTPAGSADCHRTPAQASCQTPARALKWLLFPFTSLPVCVLRSLCGCL